MPTSLIQRTHNWPLLLPYIATIVNKKKTSKPYYKHTKPLPTCLSNTTCFIKNAIIRTKYLRFINRQTLKSCFYNLIFSTLLRRTASRVLSTRLPCIVTMCFSKINFNKFVIAQKITSSIYCYNCDKEKDLKVILQTHQASPHQFKTSTSLQIQHGILICNVNAAKAV